MSMSSRAHLEEPWQEWSLNYFPHNTLPHLSQLATRQFQALFYYVAAELLLRKLGEMTDELLHDGSVGLCLAKLKNILQTVITKAILQRQIPDQPS
jgi:hypothetical protein